MILEPNNRTLICSILFIDIVGYSKQTVAEQIRMKGGFNALLGEALKNVAPNDRIILDTGDGAAISFLGDPEDALFVGLSLREAMSKSANEAGDGGIRLGINLGPVKLLKDLNGHPNLIGDGINVAQRIMSFADNGQIAVSRSYYEVVSRLSGEYEKLFQYEGARADKHVREHEIYLVGQNSEAFMQMKTSEHGDAVKIQPAGASGNAKKSAVARPGEHKSRRGLIIGASVGAMIVIVATVGLNMRSSESSTPPVAGTGDVTGGESAKATETKADKATKQAVTPQVVAAKSVTAADEKKTEDGKSQAVVNLSIAPWGEVYVDGKQRGVSPPLKSLKLTPGKYVVEVRNTTFSPYQQTVEIKTGKEKILVRYAFQ